MTKTKLQARVGTVDCHGFLARGKARNESLAMTKLSILLCLLLFVFCTSMLYAGARADKQGLEDFIVKNLVVNDVENDDGSGLQVTWEPLPKEARIISYRVYRGISKDTLFFIGEIPVNPKIGVISPTMTFFDKDFNPFVELSSPRKMKPEKGQAKDSPIYRAIPRDVSVIGPMIDKFTLLAVIPKKEFYYKTTPITIHSESEDEEENILAGMKTQQMRLLKKLKPGEEYYYTVIAVNERRQFYPYAPIVSGIPIDNPPEKPKHLYPAFVEDTNSLHFEWEQPLYRDDLLNFRIFAIKDTDRYSSFCGDYPESGNLPTEIGTLIYETRLSDWTSTTFASLNIKRDYDNAGAVSQSHIVNDKGEIVHTFSGDIVQYPFALSYIDYQGQCSYSDLEYAKIVNTTDIPPVYEISIADRPNDKGDYMYLMWGKPFARISSVTYLRPDRSRVQLNYEVATNKANKIKNIYFDIYDAQGQHIRRINEFFIDNIIKLNIPAHFESNELLVKMTFNVVGQGLDENHYLTQRLHFDDQIMTLRPEELKYRDEYVVDNFNLQVLKKTVRTGINRVSQKFSFFDRETADMTPYETVVQKQIIDFDLDKKLLLMDGTIDFTYNETVGRAVPVSIYASVATKDMEEYRNKLAEAQDKLANIQAGDGDGDIAATQREIDFYSALVNSADIAAINSITNDKSRMKKIAQMREFERRNFTYQMLISDGHGLFNLTDVALDSDGNPTYWIPYSNWFKKEMIPALIASLVFGLLVSIMFQVAKSGKDLYIRPIAGIEEIDNAIGRATEMGRPILYCPGLSTISDVATLAGLAILGRVAKKAAEYDTKILVPCRDNIVLPIAAAIVREAHSEAGRPDSYDSNNVFFVAENQFAYVAGVNGIMVREKTATNFYLGMFWAESLIMTETGNTTGAIQIAGTDAVTQIPFFITTCDYTLIGEELYAASAYMVRQPLQLGTLKACDYTKAIIMFFLILGTVMSSFQMTQIIDLFPDK